MKKDKLASGKNVINEYINKWFLLFACVLACATVTAQVVQQKVGDNPTMINANAVLDLESTKKGLLLPRLALQATDNATPLTAHTAGMTVYNTATAGTGTTAVTPGYYYNDGSRWVRIGAAITANNGLTKTATNEIQLGGPLTLPTNISNITATNRLSFTADGVDAVNFDNNTLSIDAEKNRVGIGTAAPITSLHVNGAATIGSRRTGNVAGSPSLTVGTDNVAGAYSFAMGEYNTASGGHAVAMGHGASSSGYAAIAMGYTTRAYGRASVSMGTYSEAKGENAVAMGYGTTAASYAETVMGLHNAITTFKDSEAADPNDALLQLGNGTSNLKNNAVTIMKNAHTAIGVTGTEAAAKPTELLDLGGEATTGNGGLRIRNINSAAYSSTVTTDKVVVADDRGVLKTVDRSAIAPQSILPKFFYIPSLVLPTTSANLPDGVSYDAGSQQFTVDLHAIYSRQFGMEGNVSGAARTAIKSAGAGTLPVLAATALEYFVTYFDNTVFDPATITLSNAGVMTYKVLPSSTVSEKTYMNIVFKVK